MSPSKHAANKVQLGVRVDEELKDAAKAKAHSEGRDFAKVVADLLRDYLKR